MNEGAKQKRGESMQALVPGFGTVRAVCYRCGWFRIVGYTGRSADVRALIRIERARSSCNVLWAKVIKVPADMDASEVRSRFPRYHDLQQEWDWQLLGSQESKSNYQALVHDQQCPRCKQVGGLGMDVFLEDASGGRQHWSTDYAPRLSSDHKVHRWVISGIVLSWFVVSGVSLAAFASKWPPGQWWIFCIIGAMLAIACLGWLKFLWRS